MTKNNLIWYKFNVTYATNWENSENFFVLFQNINLQMISFFGLFSLINQINKKRNEEGVLLFYRVLSYKNKDWQNTY